MSLTVKDPMRSQVLIERKIGECDNNSSVEGLRKGERSVSF